MREVAPGELTPPPAPFRLLRAGLGAESDREWRLALSAPAGARIAVPVDEVPAGARLRLAVGRLWSRQAPELPPIRATVRLTSGETTQTLRDLTLTAAGEPAWTELDLDLAAWGGRPVRIELSSEVAPAGDWVLFAHPEIVRSPATEPAAAPRPTSLVLISLDTLRADRLGSYGYAARPTSPHLDALARRSVLFRTAISAAPWTRPAHRAMLNGLYPLSNAGLVSPPLGEMLWRSGFRTAAITAGGQVDPRFEFDVGFERFRVWDWARAGDGVLDYLADDGRPYFLFLHTYEAHEPYEDTRFAAGLAPGRIEGSFRKLHHQWLGVSITDAERAYASALYDGDIAFLDERLGRLFAQFELAGVFDEAIVVVTSDHGEQFWEHGTWGHGGTVYDEEIRVPLLVRLPPATARRIAGGRPLPLAVEEQVELVDLYPTLLDLLGVALPHRVQGRSLRPLLAGAPGWIAREALAEETSGRMERKALRTQRSKFILSARSGSWPEGDDQRAELYDLRADPGERADFAPE
ncbi:MAG: sulfatase-like hydrolase/transferase, partial [Thermoanaerobaculia bacterium]|nr:sulfatase-like hydrolase/transferase [Thermoanaerobaculia bacterium]